MKALIACGVVLLAIICLMMLFGSTPSSGRVNNQTDEPALVKYSTGDTFRVGYWSYRVNSVEWKPAIYSAFGVTRPDAKFLLLGLTATNEDATASILPPMELVNERGQVFSESPEGFEVSGSFSILKQLNPGVTSTGYILFDIPPGTYRLKASGGNRSLAFAMVDLNPRPDSVPRDTQAPSAIAPAEQVAPEESTPQPAPGQVLTSSPQPAPPMSSPTIAWTAANGSPVYEVGNGVSVPILLSRGVLEYSADAKAAGITGLCVVQFVVDPQGTVQDATVVGSLGHGLDENSLAAIKEYRYRAAMLNGQPVAVVEKFAFNFSSSTASGAQTSAPHLYTVPAAPPFYAIPAAVPAPQPK